jgi:glucose/arabinose dehydrogenase
LPYQYFNPYFAITMSEKAAKRLLTKQQNSMIRFSAWALPCACLLLLSACGGGGGGTDESVQLPTPAVELVRQQVASADFPVGIAAAPDGRIFFTELKTGNIRVLQNGVLSSQPFATLQVPAEGAEGLLGIAVDPAFSSNGFVYAFQAYGEPPQNRVVRFRDQNGVGTDLRIILDHLPNGGHNGGKFAFGLDGSLFVSTGDTGNPQLSQADNSLAGKILHLNNDGSVFEASGPIYARGFRNVFGLAVHPASGELYASDNGPDCDDELDRITPGGNFGWRPDEPCNDDSPGFIQPFRRFNPPLGLTGIAFYRGAMFPEFTNQLLVGDYNSGTLRRLVIDPQDGSTILEEGTLVTGETGPILDLCVAADGSIYYTGQNAIFRLSR